MLLIYVLSEGDDYSREVRVLTFTSAPSRRYVNITILKDTPVVEQQETFGVTLSATDQCVNLTEDEATVTINDDTGREDNSYIDIQAKSHTIFFSVAS